MHGKGIKKDSREVECHKLRPLMPLLKWLSLAKITPKHFRPLSSIYIESAAKLPKADLNILDMVFRALVTSVMIEDLVIYSYFVSAPQEFYYYQSYYG